MIGSYISISNLSPGSMNRLKRIQDLKNFETPEDALDFCISLGWLAAEKQEIIRTANRKKISDGPSP